MCSLDQLLVEVGQFFSYLVRDTRLPEWSLGAVIWQAERKTVHVDAQQGTHAYLYADETDLVLVALNLVTRKDGGKPAS